MEEMMGLDHRLCKTHQGALASAHASPNNGRQVKQTRTGGSMLAKTRRAALIESGQLDTMPDASKYLTEEFLK
jgi:hypothetical protein